MIEYYLDGWGDGNFCSSGCGDGGFFSGDGHGCDEGCTDKGDRFFSADGSGWSDFSVGGGDGLGGGENSSARAK